ncbi:zeta toxin family protein [Legionella fallonii]|uniref:Uncharacterized protein n=1 Tax=Legionella fallonii LLAP-10 TaxID=1212491 RepID=A0A098G256_9GAMM|nr:zeta toxin family protein [Legionella fallonii]CEG56558.1 conserved protein of unknown function [Legionella fallonii LLAP-10]
MAKLYTKGRVNFGTITGNDLPRYEYHRTTRQAVELSATSNSYQEVRGGITYQWDNIAPEVALVILQDSDNKGVNIRQEIINQIGEDEYNKCILQSVIDTLNNNPDYALFTKKLALKISNNKSEKLTIDLLKESGINTVDQFDKVFIELLLQEKKLSKNYPNFTKIKKTDDYNQFINYLADNSLFNKFLRSFTDRVAYEYNKNRPTLEQVTAPQNIDRASLNTFLKAVSFTAVYKEPIGSPQKNTLYVQLENGSKLIYTVVSPSGDTIKDSIPLNQLDFQIDETNAQEQIQEHLPSILAITAKRGHTGDLALNSTEALRSKGLSYLSGNINHDLFLSYLPAMDMVRDEGYKFTLYQWLKEQGNLDKFKDLLVEGACQRAFSEMDQYVSQLKEYPEIDENFQQEIDVAATLMKEIIQIVSSLDNDPNSRDADLDKKIDSLKVSLKKLKHFFDITPIQQPGVVYPTSAGNFEKFVKQLVFNSTSEKMIRFIPHKQASSMTLRVNLLDLVNAFVTDRTYVEVRDSKKKEEKGFLTDENSQVISPEVALRGQLKSIITTHLKDNIHHYHTIRGYENDGLNTQQAPLGFRGGSFTDSLLDTKQFAKKFTRQGEYSADSHLLVGQENNLRKHEVRSGAAATLIAATGVDGTRSVTDKFDIALDFGGQKNVKIMYILRGKEAFHTQAFLDPFGKNKLSEMAYTNVSPSDYVMTVLYDKDNVILDVIPGNLSGEIEGVSDFSREVISACVDFYNQQHDPDMKHKKNIQLPSPSGQKSIPTSHLHERKPLIDILRTHQTKSDVKPKAPETQLGSIRIERVTDNGNKKLAMQSLRAETRLVTEPLINLQFSDAPFPSGGIDLQKEREAAVAHYNMRHVLTLKEFTQWSHKERQLQEEFNRILQPGFMEGDVQINLNNAEVAQEGWLTDVLVPTLETAFLLHVAARLITDYEIDVEQVNERAQMVCSDLGIQATLSFEQLTTKWREIRSKLNPLDNTEAYEECAKKAQEKMKKLYSTIDEGSVDYQYKFAACLEVEKNKVIKKMSNQLMSEFLDSQMDNLVARTNLSKKPVFKLEDNADLVFLGPAASGKSTISRQYVSEKDKAKYVSLATDDYRGICKPYTKDFEQKETEQVFIRTQDSAYLVSEIVEERMKNRTVERPNVIVDGVTYKSSHKELVEKNKNSILVCACLDDVAEVVKRCYNRAMQEDAGSADKGRHVNTKSLLDSHKTASINLIAYCPSNVTIKLYNTNIPKGENPPLIATVDTTNGEKTLTISHEKGSLVNIASFFNKGRLNSEARGTDSLFMNKMRDPVYQIDSLFAVMGRGFKIVVNGEDNKPCMVIRSDNGSIVMDILDPAQVKNKFEENSSDKQLLKMMILYGKNGSLTATLEECLLHSSDIDEVVSQYLDDKMAEVLPADEVSVNPMP